MNAEMTNAVTNLLHAIFLFTYVIFSNVFWIMLIASTFIIYLAIIKGFWKLSPDAEMENAHRHLQGNKL
jgi:hypothetical protein